MKAESPDPDGPPADAADPADAVELRPLDGLDELRACVALQEEVWGEGFSERVPSSVLQVSLHMGGVASGAFDAEGRLLGFVFGITGLREGRLAHWSDMLAVQPGIRDRGLGVRLKAHQRELLLERGVETVFWTFDPLESRNAWLNLGRLGAVAREYAVDMYGDSDSPLHRALGTDRLVVRWAIASRRVRERLSGADVPPGAADVADLPQAFRVADEGGLPVPGEPTEPGEGPFLVPVPRSIQALRDASPAAARRWREATRRALLGGIERGLEVRELIAGGRVCRYLLSPPGSTGKDGVRTR